MAHPKRAMTPIEQATFDALRSRHPETNGNIWLLEDIRDAIIEATDALTADNERLMGALHHTLRNQPPPPVFVEAPSGLLVPKPRDVTPERVLAALATEPSLLLGVKALMGGVRVAGAWEVFNSSTYSKRRNVSFPRGTMARFTPMAGQEECVVRIYTDPRPMLPNRHHLDEDHEWEETVREHEAEVAEHEAKPWKWSIDHTFQRMFPMDGRSGRAESKREAKEMADTVLHSAGWVLVKM